MQARTAAHKLRKRSTSRKQRSLHNIRRYEALSARVLSSPIIQLQVIQTYFFTRSALLKRECVTHTCFYKKLGQSIFAALLPDSWIVPEKQRIHDIF